MSEQVINESIQTNTGADLSTDEISSTMIHEETSEIVEHVEEESDVRDDLDDAARLSEQEIEIDELKSVLASAQMKVQEYREQMQRTTTEYENTRRRQEQKVSENIERANSKLIEQILPVLDDFDLAFQNLPDSVGEDEQAWVNGFQQIQKKLWRILDSVGVDTVSNEGEFDPHRHEAVSSEPSEEVESGYIIQTLRSGYEFKGRVLRPALVRVAM